MELWIRSTAKTNLLKARFLTIMEGKTFYKKNEWEYEGYTICNCNEQGKYELLGTYKTKERALEVLDEIQEILCPKKPKAIIGKNVEFIPALDYVYEMPKE